ncbi:MAG TPA: hypothetical protein VK960_02330 [Acidimicrobiia bacterium]|nr:hypothetical protein [Acidimicrobiia bacterium]
MSLVIPSRFNGPPGSGNGGYACGLFASIVEGDAEVTLRSPPPLEVDLEVSEVDGVHHISHDETLVAEVRPADVQLDIPAAPSVEQAQDARTRYLGYRRHEFPTCFTCGTERTDGLSIHPGPVTGTGVVASSWRADESLPASDDHLRPEIVWAALDCPGAWATMRELTADPVVLGRMSARLVEPVPVGATLVSYGWQMGADGRKAYAGTAVADERGRVLGYARQVWIVLAQRT